jgi:hypothetical protein
MGYHENNKGKFSLIISADGDVTFGKAYEELDKFKFAKLHGWLLWAAWSIFGLIQLITSRYLNIFWRVNK